MARASRQQTRQLGAVALLVAAPPPAATAIGVCLHTLEKGWARDGHLAALWQAWPRIAGAQLSPHCRPLRLSGARLVVGAAPGPWLQALQYNRPQLLGSLKAAGFPVRDLRFEQAYPVAQPPPGSETESAAWARHPSRSDVHGVTECPRCRIPAPAGEMARWGCCSLCLRQQLS